jgi:hypothetical protein
MSALDVTLLAIQAILVAAYFFSGCSIAGVMPAIL